MDLKEKLLVKRFNSLVGKLPVPRFKSKLEEDAYKLAFKLTDDVTAEFVKNELNGADINLSEEDYREYQKLKDIDKYLFILDNVEAARNHCRRFYKG